VATGAEQSLQAMETALTRMLQPKIEALKVLVVDDDQYMRKVVRTMLNAIGVKTVFEAVDGVAGLEALRKHNPDIVIVDWEMPMIDGAQFVRMVRTPGEFPSPGVPIIMLSGHGDRWRVVEAARIGAHEYLLKPVSTKALQDRIVAILGKPRPTVQLEGYYGPAPRRLVVLEDERRAEEEQFATEPQPRPVPQSQRSAMQTQSAMAGPMEPPFVPAPQPAGPPSQLQGLGTSATSNLGRRGTGFQFRR
jgi:two-component system, chemotaxis family, chemotaxis protein CheY